MQASLARVFLHRQEKYSATLLRLISSPQSISDVVPFYGMVGRTKGENLREPQGTTILLMVPLRGTRKALLTYQHLH